MTNENPILVELFRNNQWANATMLDACRGLTSEQLSTEVIGTYGRLAYWHTIRERDASADRWR